MQYSGIRAPFSATHYIPSVQNHSYKRNPTVKKLVISLFNLACSKFVGHCADPLLALSALPKLGDRGRERASGKLCLFRLPWNPSLLLCLVNVRL